MLLTKKQNKTEKRTKSNIFFVMASVLEGFSMIK